MNTNLGLRRKRGSLSQSKAKVIASEGLTKYGGGFASPRQKNYIDMVAGGVIPGSTSARKRRIRGGYRQG